MSEGRFEFEGKKKKEEGQRRGTKIRLVTG